ncbi:MAG: hypothetical protein F6K54_27035 [Okeania sp. SIO3B5]|uniref:hypothetical protein n=1 Tax=Okeania sp. SIO3B5 TaxID=2607811 RepID=UPI0014014F6A|nr:hypothetical protein [Okeania sp. SIO3B5]NEO56419.1 hypothetical protein [Okeania sp. SIO3B5]
MNQSSEIQQVKKYKPLLYITPNNKSSLQQSLSSAITTVTTEDDKSSNLTSNLSSILRAGILISEIFIDINLFPFILIPEVKRILARQQNTQDSEQAKPNENTKIALNEFNLEGWSEFITETPYSDIPEDFDFPPGHPLPGKLYRAHPLKSKSNKYIPIEVFDSLLYAEREAELIRLLVDLGANKITIKEKKVGKTATEIEANTKLTRAGGVESKIEGDINKSDESIRKLSLGGQPWSSEIVEKFDEKNYSWLAYEPAWTAVAHSRLYGKCLTASIELTNDDSYSISGKIGLAEGLLQNLTDLNLGASFIRNQNKISLIYVEFAPPEKNGKS